MQVKTEYMLNDMILQVAHLPRIWYTLGVLD
jgi:hypothetical protein